MSKPVVKKSLSSASKTNVFGPPNFFQNKLDLTDSIKADIKAKGHEWRWINYKKFVDDGGMHEMGWIPYKAERKDGADALLLGNNPDGIIRRGDCLLATRPKEFCDQHRSWNQQKTEVQAGVRKVKADELRQKAKEGRIQSAIDDEFDDVSDS